MNAEAVLIGWLPAALGDIPAFAEVPANRPDTFVTVERVGGTATEFVDHASLAVQVWSVSRYQAATLTDTLRTVLPSIVVDVEEVVNATVSSVYNWPDPDSKQSRYQLAVGLAVKWNHVA